MVVGMLHLSEKVAAELFPLFSGSEFHVLTTQAIPSLENQTVLSDLDTVSRRLFYSAAQVLITEHIQTALESLATGTPVIATSSRLAGIVQHQHNGYCPPNFKVEEIMQGVQWAMKAHGMASFTSRFDCQERFGMENNIHHYIELYDKLVAKSPATQS